jgi:hypothetical protein
VELTWPLFAHPVLKNWQRIRVPMSAICRITVADRTQPLPLSFAQQRLWFLAQLEDKASRAYQICGGVRLKGVLDAAVLKATLNCIVRRHEVLRTTFTQADGVPLQVIAPPESGFFLLEHDLTDSSERS